MQSTLLCKLNFNVKHNFLIQFMPNMRKIPRHNPKDEGFTLKNKIAYQEYDTAKGIKAYEVNNPDLLYTIDKVFSPDLKKCIHYFKKANPFNEIRLLVRLSFLKEPLIRFKMSGIFRIPFNRNITELLDRLVEWELIEVKLVYNKSGRKKWINGYIITNKGRRCLSDIYNLPNFEQ